MSPSNGTRAHARGAMPPVWPPDRGAHPILLKDNGRGMSYAASQSGRGSRSGGDDQSLVRYWRVLRERVWVIVACTILVFLASIVYVVVAPRSYQAQAVLEVQAASNADAVLAALPVLHQTGDPTEDVLTGASLVTTQPVADAVVKTYHLPISPGQAQADVSATPIGQAGLVAVQATAGSPLLAQRLANGFVAEAVALSTARMHAAIQRELPTLQGQLAAVPAAQRYGPGSLGQQVDELQQLLNQSDPTLVSAAPATVPTSPSSPRKKLSLLAGLIGGLLVGVGAAFLFHALDPRVRREEQLRDRLGLPILAHIPREPQGRRPRPLLPAELTPAGQEGYRTLRTILAARGRSRGPRAILVTGSAPGEGKSTTAIGTAVALARGGADVVLVEADLRKPTFATTFNLGEFLGLDAVLTGRIELNKALLPLKIDGAPVRVLPAHPSPVGISVGVVDKLVRDVKELADFVVIDSAPLTEVIDALPFAQAVDEVVIVVRLEQTRLGKLEELDDLLDQHGVNRTGVVLIGEHPSRRSSPYYYPDENGSSRPDGAESPIVPMPPGSGALPD